MENNINSEINESKREPDNTKNYRAIIDAVRESSDRELYAISRVGSILVGIGETLKNTEKEPYNTNKHPENTIEVNVTLSSSEERERKGTEKGFIDTKKGADGVFSEVPAEKPVMPEHALPLYEKALASQASGSKEVANVTPNTSKSAPSNATNINNIETKNVNNSSNFDNSNRRNELTNITVERSKKREWKETQSPKGEAIESIKESSEIASSTSEVVSAMGAFADFYRDETGRVRRPDGRYASSDESTQYTAAEKASEANQKEKSTSVMTRLVGTFGRIAESTTAVSSHDSTELAGAAAGGSFFYAAKEIANISKDSVEAIKDSGLLDADKWSERKQGVKDKAANLAAFVRSPFSKSSEAKSASSETTSAKSVTQRESSKDGERTELLKEQTVAQAEHTDKVVSAIEELERSGVSSGGKDGGMLTALGEMVGGDFGGPERKGGSKKGGRWGRMKSVLSNGADNVPRNASFGNAFKAGGGMLAKAAVPLAGVMAAFDRFSEIKDDETLSTSQKAAQVTSTGAGAAGGALAGAAAGAAVGSFVPVVGTAIGGLIGGVLGGMGGSEIGEKVGVSISDFMASDASLTEYVSSAANSLWESASTNATSALDSVKSMFGFGSEDTKESSEKTENSSSESGGFFSRWFSDKESPEKAESVVAPSQADAPAVSKPKIISLESAKAMAESDIPQVRRRGLAELKKIEAAESSKSTESKLDANTNVANSAQNIKSVNHSSETKESEKTEHAEQAAQTEQDKHSIQTESSTKTDLTERATQFEQSKKATQTESGNLVKTSRADKSDTSKQSQASELTDTRQKSEQSKQVEQVEQAKHAESSQQAKQVEVTEVVGSTKQTKQAKEAQARQQKMLTRHYERMAKSDNPQIAAMGQRNLEKLQAEKNVSTQEQASGYHKSESASEVVARNAQKEQGDNHQTVSLDKKSLDALKQTTMREQSTGGGSSTSNPNITVKTAVTAAPSTQIPVDFSDASLRRMAMDQE